MDNKKTPIPCDVVRRILAYKPKHTPTPGEAFQGTPEAGAEDKPPETASRFDSKPTQGKLSMRRAKNER